MLPPLLFSSAFLVWLLVWHLQDRVSCSNKGLGLQSGQCPLWFKARSCVLADQFQDVIVRPGKRSGCSAAQGASRRMKGHACLQTQGTFPSLRTNHIPQTNGFTMRRKTPSNSCRKSRPPFPGGAETGRWAPQHDSGGGWCLAPRSPRSCCLRHGCGNTGMHWEAQEACLHDIQPQGSTPVPGKTRAAHRSPTAAAVPLAWPEAEAGKRLSSRINGQ